MSMMSEHDFDKISVEISMKQKEIYELEHSVYNIVAYRLADKIIEKHEDELLSKIDIDKVANNINKQIVTETLEAVKHSINSLDNNIRILRKR